MVDLDSVEPAQSPPPAAEITVSPQQLCLQEKQLCRLCLQDADEDKVYDIFSADNMDGMESKSLDGILYDLFQIKVYMANIC